MFLCIIYYYIKDFFIIAGIVKSSVLGVSNIVNCCNCSTMDNNKVGVHHSSCSSKKWIEIYLYSYWFSKCNFMVYWPNLSYFCFISAQREFTHLHWTAENGHREVAELLLAHKADIMAADNVLPPIYSHKLTTGTIFLQFWTLTSSGSMMLW